MSRACTNWLQTYAELTEDTESAAQYWLWSGLYTIAAALERKVWIPFGLSKVYPNLYVILVGPPGRCRKGLPITLSQKILKKVGVTLAVESTSKQALVKELADAARMVEIPTIGSTMQSALAVNSKELSSLLSVDPKLMIEFLTTIFTTDEHDVWEHKVLSREPDKILGPVLNVFAATTPTYLANNVPYDAFGDGFFSRVCFVSALDKKKRIARPKISEERETLLKKLTHDLNIIQNLRGPVQWDEKAGRLFDEWYDALDRKYVEIRDERFWGFIERSHVHVMKVAMAIMASETNTLILKPNMVGHAIDIIEEIFNGLSVVFSGFGRDRLAQDKTAILKQIQERKKVTLQEIMLANWNNVNGKEVAQIIQDLIDSGKVEEGYDPRGQYFKAKGET